ncbi:uncharacterized protein LOC143848730 [Tasmannia lanceolata]|uniref:uncharacterized protein LOC143848730 n=1 Tax=Tasmannia lanceolata TaxID=3420 RepID=UPI0040645ED4
MGAIPPTGTFHNLTLLMVRGCDRLRCLFSPVLAQCLQQLEHLYVEDCFSLEKINLPKSTNNNHPNLPQVKGCLLVEHSTRPPTIGIPPCIWEEEQELGVVDKETLLPRLETIHLMCLPKLTSLCCHLNRGGGSHVFLHFPSLISIWVSYCPNVKRFPVRPHNAPKLEEIRGQKAWFEGLEWEDEGDMSRLQPLFQEWEDEGGEDFCCHGNRKRLNLKRFPPEWMAPEVLRNEPFQSHMQCLQLWRNTMGAG